MGTRWGLCFGGCLQDIKVILKLRPSTPCSLPDPVLGCCLSPIGDSSLCTLVWEGGCEGEMKASSFLSVGGFKFWTLNSYPELRINYVFPVISRFIHGFFFFFTKYLSISTNVPQTLPDPGNRVIKQSVPSSITLHSVIFSPPTFSIIQFKEVLNINEPFHLSGHTIQNSSPSLPIDLELGLLWDPLWENCMGVDLLSELGLTT